MKKDKKEAKTFDFKKSKHSHRESMIWRPTTLVIAAGAIFWKVEA